MKSHHLSIAIAVMVMLATAGCNTSLQMGDRVVGIQSGQFFFTRGTLTTEYSGTSFDKVWAACEKTLEDLKASNVVTQRKIASGTLTGDLEEEEVRMSVEYLSQDITSVSIRVGTAGSNLASQFIHEKIKEHLKSM